MTPLLTISGRINPANCLLSESPLKGVSRPINGETFPTAINQCPVGKRNFDSWLLAQQFHLVCGLNLSP
ncbi:hypothetical protein CEXT_666781 [Caerostris extrusa]|uniref:Uncharacterized protein n=1 Tax=Caerostris extrusa TaxID=172846 RepID=A0AAV4RAE4_CAEEX|nr:hypothetical protein CEXT_666781 [Caerostris extrusa]